jgi:hypothetical protein
MPRGRPFRPGEVSNPKGRPKELGPAGLAKYIRRETREGRELVDRLLAIARGEATATREVASKDGGVVTLTDRPSHRERLTALEALWDRGLGTAIPADKMPEPEASASGESGSDADLEPPKLGAA